MEDEANEIRRMDISGVRNTGKDLSLIVRDRKYKMNKVLSTHCACEKLTLLRQIYDERFYESR